MEIQGYAPYLCVNDAESAIVFYSRVFGTKPWLLLNMPDGRVMHSEFRVGDTRFFLSDEFPEYGGTPSRKTLVVLQSLFIFMSPIVTSWLKKRSIMAQNC